MLTGQLIQVPSGNVAELDAVWVELCPSDCPMPEHEMARQDFVLAEDDQVCRIQFKLRVNVERLDVVDLQGAGPPADCAKWLGLYGLIAEGWPFRAAGSACRVVV